MLHVGRSDRLPRLIRGALTILLWATLAALMVACLQEPTPVVLSEEQATQTALPVPASPAAASDVPVVLRLRVKTFAGFDPLEARDGGTEQVQAMLYETLLAYNEMGDLQPLLAAELPAASDDGMRWTIAVREGVTFHNGQPLDAVAVADVLEGLRTRPLDEETDWPLAVLVFRRVVRAVTADGGAVTVELREPFPDFPYLLTDQALAVVRGEGVGTGPFVLDSDDLAAGSLLLRANPDYHGGVPALAAVRVDVFGGGAQPEAIMESSDGDRYDLAVFQEQPLPGEVDPDYEVVSGPEVDYWLVFNRHVEPLSLQQVRQALLAAYDGQRGIALASLATVGLPDGFDVQAWNAAGVDLLPRLQGAFSSAHVGLDDRNVSYTQLLDALMVNAQLGTEANTPPALFIVSFSDARPWERRLWLTLAGSEVDNGGAAVEAPGLMLAVVPSLIVQRRGLSNMAVTSGGWPRITAQTSLP